MHSGLLALQLFGLLQVLLSAARVPLPSQVHGCYTVERLSPAASNVTVNAICKYMQIPSSASLALSVVKVSFPMFSLLLLEDYGFWWNRDHRAKSAVWTMQALFADDQLRQRVAWALSQIYVCSVSGGGYSERAATWQGKDFFRVSHIMTLVQIHCSALCLLTLCDSWLFNYIQVIPLAISFAESQQLSVGKWRVLGPSFV